MKRTIIVGAVLASCGLCWTVMAADILLTASDRLIDKTRKTIQLSEDQIIKLDSMEKEIGNELRATRQQLESQYEQLRGLLAERPIVMEKVHILRQDIMGSMTTLMGQRLALIEQMQSVLTREQLQILLRRLSIDDLVSPDEAKIESARDSISGRKQSRRE
ncbi:hypothetical protein JW905_13370 [bacterium]|nr:hypothetical protein [candidate division CSSED10-310 bacterium]